MSRQGKTMNAGPIRFLPGCVAMLSLVACASDNSISVEMAAAMDKIEYADSYYQRGQYAEAIPLYEEGLKVRPKLGDPTRRLAVCYEQMGQLDRAVMAYRRFLFEVDHRDAEVLFQLARLHENSGRLQDALDTYRTLLKDSPNHAEAGTHVQRLEGLLKKEQGQQ